MVTPSRRARRVLRRYSERAKGPCSSRLGYHNGEAAVGECPDSETSQTLTAEEARGSLWRDELWPAKCEACGYAFQDDDQWLVQVSTIWRAADGREWLLRDLPPGAMWHAPWLDRTTHGRRAPDGRALVVKLPDGTHWCVDGPATNGPGWTRSGEWPRVTAAPSIDSGGYHGFLRDGVLTDDVGGRSYPA